MTTFNRNTVGILLNMGVMLVLAMSDPTFSLASRPSNDQNQPAQSAGQPERVTIPAGGVISVRIADDVDSSHNRPGDLLTGTVDPSVFMDNRVVIPRGTEAHMRMVEDKKGGRLHGKAEVRIELVSLVLNGQKLEVESDTYRKKQGALSAKAKAEVKPGAKAAGTAAADTAISGNPAGAAAGPAIAAFHAARVKLKAGSRIRFTLINDFTFDVPVESGNPQP